MNSSGPIVIIVLVLVLVGMARLFLRQPKPRRHGDDSDRDTLPSGPDPTAGFRDPYR